MTYRAAKDEVTALSGLSLEIPRATFVSIVGPSGCGKSTLLRLIAGLQLSTTGEILVNGRRVDAPMTDLGIVFQTPVLLDWLTVLDNILLQVELRRLSKADYVERAHQLVAAVDLSGFEHAHPRELSGGMAQRAAIARALIHDPPLLLMDEPFGALDALTREQMRVDLEELWLARPKTVVFITHSIDEAVLLSDFVVVMSPRPGKVEQIMEIDMPRPRGLGSRTKSGFDDAVARITSIFLAHGVLRSRPGGLRSVLTGS